MAKGAPKGNQYAKGNKGGGRKSALKEKFPSYVIPQSDAFMSLFPYKNEASYGFAPVKVYPAIQKQMDDAEEAAVIGIELYDVSGDVKEIGFVVPVGLSKAAYQPLYDAFE